MIGLRFIQRHVLLSGALLFGLANAASAADRCAAPDDVMGAIGPLPHVASVLKAGGTLDVLTVGSATVFSPTESLQPGTVTGRALGIGNNPPAGALVNASDSAFPLQMAQAVRVAVPGLLVNVTVKGGRGMTASEMLDLLHRELAAKHYQLVLWQTGTVEAVRNVPASAFYQTLSDGSAAITEAGADLILVDPQFSRFLRTNSDLDPYTAAMQQIAAQPAVLLFHRFELMRYWATEGSIDLERTPKAQRVATVEALHACLGLDLARMVMEGARAAP